MKFYLASRYSRRVEMSRYRSALHALGHEVTGRWIDGMHQVGDDGTPLGDSGEKLVESGDPTAAEKLRVKFARDDIEDVMAADVVIVFTEEPRVSGASRGGRHVEFGIALAARKWVITIGPRENIFTWLPEVPNFPSWADYLDRADLSHLPGRRFGAFMPHIDA